MNDSIRMTLQEIMRPAPSISSDHATQEKKIEMNIESIG